MAKKMETWQIAVLVILAFAFVVGGIWIAFNQGLFGTLSITDDSPGLCSGQVLNINPSVNLEFSNQLNKEVFVVTYSSLPSSECLRLKIDEELFEAASQDLEVQGDVLLDIRLDSQDKVFNIREATNPIQIFTRFKIENIDNVFLCSDARCESEGISNPLASLRRGGFPATDCFCIAEQDMGRGGDFTLTEGIEWEATLKVGNLPSRRLGTTEGLSTSIGNIVFAEWSGNLQSNVNFAGLVGQKDAYKPLTTNSWRMIGQGTFNTINSNFDDIVTDLEQCENSQAQNPTNPPICLTYIVEASGFNSNFDAVTQDQTDDWSVDEPIVANGEAEIISNQLIASLESPIVYPTFRLLIDAEEVGIFQEVGGRPIVNCPSNFDINSGQTSSEIMTIENPGSSRGTYEFSLDCDEGSQFLNTQPPRNINSNQILDVHATFGRTVEEGTERTTCTFTAIEQNLQQLGQPSSRSCTFNYDSTHVGSCVDDIGEGNSICEVGDTQLWTCNADGSFTKTPCTFGCEAVGNDFRCRLEPKETQCSDGIDNDGDGLIDMDDPDCIGGDCEWWNLWCKVKNLFSGIFDFLTILYWAIVIIVPLILLFVVENFLREVRGLSDNSVARWLISLSISIAIGIFLGLFVGGIVFWVLLILSIIILFTFPFLKNFIG